MLCSGPGRTPEAEGRVHEAEKEAERCSFWDDTSWLLLPATADPQGVGQK